MERKIELLYLAPGFIKPHQKIEVLFKREELDD